MLCSLFWNLLMQQLNYHYNYSSHTRQWGRHNTRTLPKLSHLANSMPAKYCNLGGAALITSSSALKDKLHQHEMSDALHSNPCDHSQRYLIASL